MGTFCIDAHAHLYDCYDLDVWCESAVAHLGDGACVIVVDRVGQDSVARLLRHPSMNMAVESLSSRVGVVVTLAGGRQLLVVRGVQYVAEERIEVLGLGAARSSEDGLPAQKLIEQVVQAGGVPCLPWSPGKWLGKRGKVAQAILESATPGALTVGDIAIRSWAGPPSLLLRHAARRGFSVVCGTDPLPRKHDQSLVGEFGMSIEGSLPEDLCERVHVVLQRLATGKGCSTYGRRNGPLRAMRRFMR
jgi:hypothetical protein